MGAHYQKWKKPGCLEAHVDMWRQNVESRRFHSSLLSARFDRELVVSYVFDSLARLWIFDSAKLLLRENDRSMNPPNKNMRSCDQATRPLASFFAHFSFSHFNKETLFTKHQFSRLLTSSGCHEVFEDLEKSLVSWLTRIRSDVKLCYRLMMLPTLGCCLVEDYQSSSWFKKLFLRSDKKSLPDWAKPKFVRKSS